MEFNKIAGASIGALLLFLLLNFFSAMVYGTEEVEHAPADGDGLVLAYAVPVEAGATQQEPAAIDLFALLKDADPAKGEKVARACVACHSFKEGEVKIGPPLYDVVGRKIAAEPEFSYSDAMKAEAEKDTTWTPEHLFHFVDDPQKVVPGTLMTFAGVKKPEDRANLIAYLNTLGGSPIDLTEGLEPLAPAEGEAASGDEGGGTEVAATGDAATSGGTETAAGDGAGGIAEEVAAADPAAGEKVFARCGVCHSTEAGENKIGPSLYGVVGRDIGSEEGFSYSDAMLAEKGSWTPEKLSAYLEDPQAAVPGNKMPFPGLPKKEDRLNVIAYLEQVAGTFQQGAAAPADEDTTQTTSADTASDAGEPAASDADAAASDADAAASDTDAAEPAETADATETAPEADASADAEEATAAADTEETESGATETTASETDAAEPEATDDAAAPESAEEGGGETATEAGAATAVATLDGDAANGEKIFRRCAICHSLEPGENKIGPSLHDVIGRDIGTEEGFDYSDAMKTAEGTWTPEHLSAFLEDPQAAVPGNKMPFPGIPKEQDRTDLITYLQQASQ